MLHKSLVLKCLHDRSILNHKRNVSFIKGKLENILSFFFAMYIIVYEDVKCLYHS